MKKITTLIFTCFLLLTNSDAQQSFFDAGVFGGFSFYKGEIDAAPFLQHTNPFPAAGLFLRCHVTPHFAMKLSLMAGKIADNDNMSLDHEMYNRNLSFQSHILEGAFTLEYNLLKYQPDGQKIFTPYFFGGIGVFNFNPKALYEGDLIALQPLGTEGQGTTAYPDRKPYKLTDISFPFGIGMKLALSPEITLSAEFGWRVAMTDYLDDVSTTYVDPLILTSEKGIISAKLSNRILNQDAPLVVNGRYKTRGDGKTYDWYYFSGISISYQFKSSKKDFYSLMTNKRVKCPYF